MKGVNYKFVTEKEERFYVYNPKIKHHVFTTIKLGDWAFLDIRGRTIHFTVSKGYAWDGCSPKFKIGGVIIGTPDGFTRADTLKPTTYYASLAHDLLYQFLGKHSLSRREADWTFYYIMKKDSFLFAPVYFLAVRLFGRVALTLFKKTKQGKELIK